MQFMLGDWFVDVATLRLKCGDETVVLEPLPMAVLATLCGAPGQVVSADGLLDACWRGMASSDNPVQKVISGLRRALRDNATEPRYIETLRKRGYRLVAPVRVVSAEGERSHQGGWRGKSPFRGLEAFGVEHASVFFGRDEAIAAVVQRLGEQYERGHPLVVLLGPSGSGKTSLAQAGVVPALLARAEQPQALARLRTCTATLLDLGTHEELGLWQTLAAAMLDWETDDRPLLSGYSVETLAIELRERPADLMRLLRLECETRSIPAAAPPLIVLDRFEALLQTSSPADVDDFVGRLDEMVRSRALAVIVICRNDFYPELARHRALMRGKAQGAHVDLEPPGAEALSQTIRLPARAAELRFGTHPDGLRRLDDRLCADAAQAHDALPLLQYALQSLYLTRAPGDELTWAAYEAMGGLEGAVSQRAEATLAALPARQQEAMPQLLARLVGLTAEDAVPTGRWARMAELADDEERALVRALVDARLLVAGAIRGVTGVRVAHEALLRRWPRVTNWIAQHRATLALRDELTPWVQRWRDGGCADALLLPHGATLWKAADAIATSTPLFDAEDRRYVACSLGRLRQQTRRRWGAAAAIVVLGVAAGVSAVRYAHQARIASERELQSQRLASFMLGDLADRLRPIGKLELLASIGEQGVKLLGGDNAGGEMPNDTLQRAKSLVMIAEVENSSGRGHVDVALDALRQAERLLVPLESASGLVWDDYYKTLGAQAFWRAQIAYDANEFELAQEWMTRYRAACERWRVVVPGSEQARVEMSYATSSLGSIAMRRGAWAEAARQFQDALSLKLGLLQAHPDRADLVEATAAARTWLGRLAVIQGNPQHALAMFDAAHADRESLRIRHPSEKLRTYGIGVLDVHRAGALKALGRPVQALQALQEGVARLREAVQADPANQRWLAERFSAEVALLQLRVELAQPITDDWRALRERVADQLRQAPSGDYAWREIAARMALLDAEVQARAGEWTRARAASVALGPQLESLLSEFPHDPRARELQARRVILGIRSIERTGARDALRPWCVLGAQALRPSVESGHAGLVLETWLRARQCAGDGDPDAASLRKLTVGGYVPTVLS